MQTTGLLLYYISDRSQFPGSESERRRQLLQKISAAAGAGVDFVQLREKDLPSRDLELLANEAVKITRNSEKTKLLINSRVDLAIACNADGVHLPANDFSPREVREIWQKAGGDGRPAITLSCHTPEEVKRSTADLALFAPVFEKNKNSGVGLKTLAEACRRTTAVLALGGVTEKNVASCLQAGAAGIAAIRLFQQNDMRQIVGLLRALS